MISKRLPQEQTERQMVVGSSFVRLERISESIDPLSFEFSQEFIAPFTIPIGESVGASIAEDDTLLIAPSVSPIGGDVNETGGFDSFTQSLGVNFGGLSGNISLSSPGAIWDPTTNTLTYGPDSYGGSWQIQVNSDGTYTFEQLGAMEHPDTENPNDSISITITIIVTSENGLSAESSFIVNILDDGPSIIGFDSNTTDLQLSVFDSQTLSEGGSTDSVDLSSLFSVDVDYGADGPGALNWSYALGLVASDTPPIQLPIGDSEAGFPSIMIRQAYFLVYQAVVNQ
ncbi:MAG: hypothetical protein LRY63_02330 [Nitrincola sp.]|nr:hypothetical protein [Nitrincola sp.]